MTTKLAAKLSRALVGCYPARWRQRYGEELLEVLDQHRPGVRTVLNLAAAALGAHLDPAYRNERLTRIHLWARAKSCGYVALVAVFPVLFGAFVARAALVGDHPGPAFGAMGAAGVTFSPDQRILVTTTPTFTIWNVADPAHPKSLVGFNSGQGCCGPPAFSPDGRVLAGGNNDNVILWNVADPARPTRITVLPRLPDLVSGVGFSPDGHTLATGYGDTLVLWNVVDPARPRRLQTLFFDGNPGPYTMDVPGMALAFSPNGNLLANASGHNKVSLWSFTNPDDATHIATLTGHTDGITSLSFSHDGRVLATASNDGTVILWNVTDPGRPVRGNTLRIAAAPATTPVDGSGSDTYIDVAFSASGRTLTTIVHNDTAALWNATNPNATSRITTLTRKDPGSGSIALSPDGRTVAGAATDGSYMVNLWTLPNRRPSSSAPDQAPRPVSCRPAPSAIALEAPATRGQEDRALRAGAAEVTMS